MRVYIAAPWKHKDTADTVRKQVEAAGHDVVSRWITFEANPAVQYDYPDDIMRHEAQNDLDDLESADVVLYLNLAKSEGKATELGYALASAIPIFVVGGKQNNVFLHLPPIYGIFHVDSVEDAIGALDN